MSKKIQEQIDLSQYYTPTEFDKPEVLEEIEQIKAEIELVLEGAKIDRSKMLTTFNMQLAAKTFCQTAYPKTGFWTFPTNMDIFRAGIIYGSLAKNTKQ
jgi:hypothetical protein